MMKKIHISSPKRRRGVGKWTRRLGTMPLGHFSGRVEPLEHRHLLAATPLAMLEGNIAVDGGTRDLNLTVELPNASADATVVIGLMVMPAGDSILDPAAPRLEDVDGNVLSVLHASDDVVASNGFSLVELRSGEYTIVVGGDSVRSSAGAFRVEVFLPGDSLNEDGRVDERERLHATAAVVQQMGAANHVTRLFFRHVGIDFSQDQYDLGLDANRDGVVDNFDLAQIEKNRLAGLVTVELTGDQDPPVIEVGLQNDTGVDGSDGITSDPAIAGTISDEGQIASFLMGIDGSPTIDLLELLGDISDTGEFTVTASDLESANGGPLSEGEHTLRFEATDELDNTTATPIELTFTLLVDNEAPTIAPIVDEAVDEDDSLKLSIGESVTDADAGDVVDIVVTGQGGAALPSWLQFSVEDGVLAGTPANEDVGSVSVVVTATDTQGASTSVEFDITVNNVNDAPTSTPISTQAAVEEVPFELQLSDFFADVDVGDTLTYTAVLGGGGALPIWLTLDSATGLLSGTPTNDNVGEFSVLATATDSQSESVLEVFTISVADVNDLPVLLEEIEDQRAVEEELFSLNVSSFFSDPDPGDVLTYSVRRADGSPLPGWLSIDAETGLLSGTPQNEDIADLTIEISAIDRFAATVSDTIELFVLNVNDPPTVEPIPDQIVIEDVAFSIDVGAFFDDVDLNDNLIFLGNQVGGDPLPSWIELDAESGLLSGLANNDEVGTISIEIRALDANLEEVSDTFDVTVANANDAPIVIEPIGDQTVQQDDPFSLDTSKIFDDVDVGDQLTFTAAQSSGEALPAWLGLDTATGTLSGTPTNDDVGTINIKVAATDTGMELVSSSFALTVINVNDAPVIKDQTLLVDPDNLTGSLLGSVAATDPDPGDVLSFAILAGDQAGLFSIDSDSGQIETSDVDQLTAGQSFSLTIEVTDAGDPALSDTATVTINVTMNNRPTASEIPDQQVTERTSLQFDVAGSFSDADPQDQLIYLATLIGGEPLPSWLTLNGDTGEFAANSPGNADVGTHSIEVTATDTAGAQASETFDITVVNVNDDPSLVSPIPNQSVDEDDPFSLAVTPFFTDPDLADVLTLSATLVGGAPLPVWLSMSGSGELSGTPLNEHVGTVSLEVTATDSAQSSVSQSFDLTVNNTNDAPAAGNDSGFSVRNAEELTISASNLLSNDDDPDVGDSISVALVASTSALGATVTFSGDQIIYDPTTSTQLTELSADQQLVDTFQYTIEDQNQATATATISVTVTGGGAATMRFRMDTTDLDGNSITSIAPGESFLLQVFVEDVRDNPSGVFSPYLDVTYDDAFVGVDGDIEFDPSFAFPDTTPGKLDVPGLIDEVGAIAGLSSTGGGEQLLFSLQFVAGDTPGIVTFAGNQADESPLHDVLFFSPPEPVSPLEIDYGGTTLAIESDQVAFAALSTSAINANDDSESDAQLPPIQPASADGPVSSQDLIDAAHAQSVQYIETESADQLSFSSGSGTDDSPDTLLSDIALQLI